MKGIVIYDSKTGNTKAMAELIVSGMQKVEGFEAKACPIDEVDEAWAIESRCIITGSPIYFAGITAAMKTYLDGPFRKCQPFGKIGGAFATLDYIYGGGDLGIRSMLDHMMVCGMLIYSGGGSFGKPVIHLGPSAIKGHLKESKETFLLYGERMAKKTSELF